LSLGRDEACLGREKESFELLMTCSRVSALCVRGTRGGLVATSWSLRSRASSCVDACVFFSAVGNVALARQRPGKRLAREQIPPGGRAPHSSGRISTPPQRLFHVAPGPLGVPGGRAGSSRAAGPFGSVVRSLSAVRLPCAAPPSSQHDKTRRRGAVRVRFRITFPFKTR
jgi:hypothetical protein